VRSGSRANSTVGCSLSSKVAEEKLLIEVFTEQNPQKVHSESSRSPEISFVILGYEYCKNSWEK
jgi:hypothetical protein